MRWIVLQVAAKRSRTPLARHVDAHVTRVILQLRHWGPFLSRLLRPTHSTMLRTTP